MDRWLGTVKVPLQASGGASFFRVAASLCVSPTSGDLVVPSANAIFFNGDRVEGTGNPLIERLTDLQYLASVVASKFGGFVNAWVIEASTFNGPFAVYKELIPSVNQWGEPLCYEHDGYPASRSITALFSNFMELLAKDVTGKGLNQSSVCQSPFALPDTYIVGFSKGGTVLNQLVTECAFSEVEWIGDPTPQPQINLTVPSSSKSLLDSISEIHYVDVGLNSPGAYLIENVVIEHLAKCVINRGRGMRFVLHGTPRQWCDTGRDWIRREKEELVKLLKSETGKSEGKLNVLERFYFSGRAPDLQMHFQIIEALDVC